MDGRTSTNQSENGLQEADTSQLEPSGGISDLLNGTSTVEHIAPEQFTEGSKQVDPEQIITHHTVHEGAPILTIEAFNDIVEGGRESPTLVYSTEPEFFKVKELRFTRGMHKFDHGNGTFTISQPVAMQ